MTNKNLFRKWYSRYSALTGVSLESLTKGPVGPRMKEFNNKLLVLKSSYNFTNDDIENLIDYHYTINPLQITDNKRFGDMSLLMYAARHYTIWIRENAQVIEALGSVRDFMYLTAPEQKQIDAEYAELIETLNKK